MKNTWLILAVVAAVIYFLFKGNTANAATNPLAFPSTLPLPPASNLGTSLSTLPSPLPTYTAAPQGPVQGGSWIGGPIPPPDATLTPYTYSDPTVGTNAPAATVAPDFSTGFFSAGGDTSSVFLA